LDITRVSEVGEGEIAQHFAAIVNALKRSNGFLAGVDITEADGVELEDGSAKGSEQKQSDKNLREGHTQI